MRGSAKDDSADAANDTLPVFAGKRLAVHDKVFDDEAAHAVCDKNNGAVTKTSVDQCIGDVASALFDNHTLLTQSGETRRIANSPDAVMWQVFAQFFRPKEMSGLSFFAVPPSAMRGTAETMDEHDVHLSILIRHIGDLVKSLGIRSHGESEYRLLTDELADSELFVHSHDAASVRRKSDGVNFSK